MNPDPAGTWPDLLEQLRMAKAATRGTTLITYIVAGRTKLSDIMGFIARERSTSNCIKNNATRKAVTSQLNLLAQSAQVMCKTGFSPANGLVMLAGAIASAPQHGLAPLAYV